MANPLNTDHDQTRVLIVDDDRDFATQLAGFLQGHCQTQVVHNGPSASTHLGSESTDVVLLDLDLGRGDDGFAILEEIRTMAHPPQVLMLTGDRNPRTIVNAIKAGAYHYICKPPVVSELINLIQLAAEQSKRSSRLAYLESRVNRLGGKFVVRDPAMQRVVDRLKRVAPTPATVLVIGESGTGKELVANHLHELSRRASGPFIAVNCAAITESLAESEFFGHAKGGFTGAEEERPGYFQMAHGGTIFLDEIGLAPSELQTMLLRVLESREVRKVRGTELEKVDVRVVAASSNNLQEAVDKGEFHEALFFRLREYQLQIPPLRARPEDIIALSSYFLKVFGEDMGRPGLEFSDSAREHLLQHEWPGNVRDLKSTILRAVIDSDDLRISARHLIESTAPWDTEMLPYEAAKDRWFQQWQRMYLKEQLDRAGGNVTEAARLSGLNRTSFSRMMSKYGMSARG